MCGICGYITDKRIDSGLITHMTETLIHRGPDDFGTKTGHVGGRLYGLGHRRLSIMDLSYAGHQPMESDDGRFVIVFNGEIYNFREIKEELVRLGYSFKSNSDTEVMLCSYIEWGEEAFEKWNGMFAAGILDNVNARLILIRDRIGQKPLYYYWDGETLLFASELKAIMKWPGFQRKLRPELLSRYMYRGYIAAPDTIFKNTYKLKPAHYIVWHKGELKENSYWDLRSISFAPEMTILPYEEIKRSIKDLLRDAVRYRLVADVPVGTFLSGGIDSSLISAMAQEIYGGSLKTYSIGFEDDCLNEANYAKEIARYLGTDHHEQYLSKNELFDMFSDISIYYDEPFADSSQIPTMLVSKLARHDVKVALSGDGGDEFFCGYNAYLLVKQFQNEYPLRVLYALRYMLGDKTVEKRVDVFRKPDYLSQLVGRSRHEILSRCNNVPVEYEEEKNIPESDWQRRRMKLDSLIYLPDDILTKVDRASMRFSLECRSPFCDYRVVEAAFSIPHKYLFSPKKELKYILKDILSDYIPRDLFERKKQGFCMPVGECLRQHRDMVMSYCDRKRIVDQGLFRPDPIIKIADSIMNGSNEDERLLWKYVVFQEWYDRYMMRYE